MEISYTKQQQKQKTKQSNRNQDSDTMEVFEKDNQLLVHDKTDNYFQYTLSPASDKIKTLLDLPISVPIFKLAYSLNGKRRHVSVYPTLQFLYSNFIHPKYITRQVKDVLESFTTTATFCSKFMATVNAIADQGGGGCPCSSFLSPFSIHGSPFPSHPTHPSSTTCVASAPVGQNRLYNMCRRGSDGARGGPR